jgi:hypothetical protein
MKLRHTRAIVIVQLLIFAFVSARAMAATFFGPSPYLSSADIPTGLYAGGLPTALEDFEDRSLDFGMTVSGGGTSPPALPTRTDSVDADDGVIDGSGSAGTSWFIDDLGGFAELIFTFPNPLPTAAGVVWTDGALTHDISFEAFGPGMVSLGVIGPFHFADALNTGQTGEDRFFGVMDAGGIFAIRVSNTNAAGGLEVDHVQFGTMVPVPSAIWLFLTGVVALVGAARRE